MDKQPTQAERILKRLQEANGEWISGRVFLHEMMLSQYHARIFDLQNNRERYKYVGVIEASEFTDDFGFKSYRLRRETGRLFELPAA